MAARGGAAGGPVPKERQAARAAFFCAACSHGHAQDCAEWLQHLNSSSAAQGGGGEASMYDAAGVSGLHLAAGNGHAALVTSILNSGLLSVDAEELGRPKPLTEGGGRQPSTGRTPLHWASSGGHAEVRFGSRPCPHGWYPAPRARTAAPSSGQNVVCPPSDNSLGAGARAQQRGADRPRRSRSLTHPPAAHNHRRSTCC